MERNGFGIKRSCTFPVLSKSLTCITPASTYGIYLPNSILAMHDGKIEILVRLLRATAVSHPDLAEQIGTEIHYFETNKERMRYPKFRKQGLFVGSGVIEAGCKAVLGRLKQSGMFWTVRGANAIITLRCCQLSGRFEDYWESRRVPA
jgi:hypothetical protein